MMTTIIREIKLCKILGTVYGII